MTRQEIMDRLETLGYKDSNSGIEYGYISGTTSTIFFKSLREVDYYDGGRKTFTSDNYDECLMLLYKQAVKERLGV